MTPVIEPSTTALLSMDFQNAIVSRVPDSAALLARQAAALAAARAAGVTVAHVRVGFADGEKPGGGMGKRIPAAMLEHFHADAPGTQVHDDVAPQAGEIVVRKVRVGPFSTTDLHEQLRARGIDTLIITGISTSGVVLSAVRDAHDRDYNLIVVSDLVADPDPEVHEVLTTKVLAHQADVISAAELSELLG
jgi:nicotinamidase-related amidase